MLLWIVTLLLGVTIEFNFVFAPIPTSPVSCIFDEWTWITWASSNHVLPSAVTCCLDWTRLLESMNNRYDDWIYLKCSIPICPALNTALGSFLYSLCWIESSVNPIEWCHIFVRCLLMYMIIHVSDPCYLILILKCGGCYYTLLLCWRWVQCSLHSCCKARMWNRFPLLLMFFLFCEMKPRHNWKQTVKAVDGGNPQ